MLNEAETAWTEGFSLEPDGNEIAITFGSLFGSPVQLAPRHATATSASVLSFDFPDSTAEGLPLLAGPVDIRVVADGGLAAHIRGSDLVGLPPPTDVTPIVLGENTDITVLAALGADGDIWIPASFHGDPMAMPGCPGNFIFPIPVLIGGAVVNGPMPSSFNPLERIRGIAGYLGDIEIDGFNFYGMLYPEDIKLVHTDGTLGVSVCRLNDAMDLVLRVRGDQAWARMRPSPFRLVARDSAPIPLRLTAAPLCPAAARREERDRLRASRSHRHQDDQSRDSFGNVCSPGARN